LSPMDCRFLTRDFEREHLFRLETYVGRGGYEAAAKALKTMTPSAVLEEVKAANLRGRGGAGFPAGVKWGFVPKGGDAPRYLCVNADEGEPGTFKDRFLMGHNPHLLLEGMIIASFASGIRRAYIYIRGEYEHLARRLEEAAAEARSAGWLGDHIAGTDFGLDVFVHRGAGAYICGEETALLESLEGKRGHPRLKPPFPASVGLFRCPTVINNVETLCCVPDIILHGAPAFLRRGLPRDGGTRLFSVSGAVARPGCYELPVGAGLRELIFGPAGGMRGGRKLKAVIPGGLSAPVLTAAEIDIALDGDSLAEAGSMLGSAGVIVIDDRTPVVGILSNMAAFYAHESCGQCTPCRIGTAWMAKISDRMASGRGRAGDLETIVRVAESLRGRTLCPMGDAAALPILSLTAKFRDELQEAAR